MGCQGTSRAIKGRRGRKWPQMAANGRKTAKDSDKIPRDTSVDLNSFSFQFSISPFLVGLQRLQRLQRLPLPLGGLLLGPPPPALRPVVLVVGTRLRRLRPGIHEVALLAAVALLHRKDRAREIFFCTSARGARCWFAGRAAHCLYFNPRKERPKGVGKGATEASDASPGSSLGSSPGSSLGRRCRP